VPRAPPSGHEPATNREEEEETRKTGGREGVEEEVEEIGREIEEEIGGEMEAGIGERWMQRIGDGQKREGTLDDVG
jgi:hypothetical protein